MNRNEVNWKSLALKIRTEIFEPTSEFTRKIFLCGADPKDPNSMRGPLAEAIIDSYFSLYYQIIYPEDVFDDLLYHRRSPDLLSLENLLVDNVHAVVIIPESPGSFTELGAFTNNPQLRQKIVCVMNRKYKNDKSFINRGPIRLIRKEHPGRVVFTNPEDVATAASEVRNIVRAIKNSPAGKSSLNLFQIANFLLPAIYLLEPVSHETLVKLVGYASDDSANAYALTVASLSSLEKKRFVEIRDSKYCLTRHGVDANFRVKRRGPGYKLLDSIRLEIFNMRYRNRVLKI